MPIPPIQCVKLLQNNNDFGSDSISVNMEAPVVVKPETDSNNAFTKEGMAPEKMYGRLPIKQIITQEEVTVR